GVTAVTRRRATIVARLVASDDAVAAALGLAGGARRRTHEAALELTGDGAAVARDRVAVVAGLASVERAVAAGEAAARGRAAAAVAGLDETSIRAAVTVLRAAVVALLAG